VGDTHVVAGGLWVLQTKTHGTTGVAGEVKGVARRARWTAARWLKCADVWWESRRAGARTQDEDGTQDSARKASGNKKEAKRLSRAEFPTNQSRGAARRGPGIADESDSADAPVDSQSPAGRQTETHHPAL